MLFYRITICFDDAEDKDGKCYDGLMKAKAVQTSVDALNKTIDGGSFIGCECDLQSFTAAACFEKCGEVDKHIDELIHTLGITGEARVDEVTNKEFCELAETAKFGKYIVDDKDTLEQLGVADLHSELRRSGIRFSENFAEALSRSEIESRAKRTLYRDSLEAELDRIFASSPVGFAIPCHYVFSTDDTDERRDAYQLLISALYANDRLMSRRYIFADLDAESGFRQKSLEELYKSCQPGEAIVIRYNPACENGEYMTPDFDAISDIGKLVLKHRFSVLSIICIPKACGAVKAGLLGCLADLNVVELEEYAASAEQANDYLHTLCVKYSAEPNDDLCVSEDRRYTSAELKSRFDQWYSTVLRTKIFSQYDVLGKKDDTPAVSEAKLGTAYDRLMRMTGLNGAKQVITQALDYAKSQRLYLERGFMIERPAMNFAFLGKPGTAKTTVARLLGEIFFDAGLLKSKKVVECGRADLVGKYVGSTAPLVKKQFKNASGGILFIDEAYSLVDGKDGYYGDEAINTIVQEIENNRGDTMVIFAGYPDKMEAFLSRNPGLRSRIQFTVPFDDYSADELVSISDLIADDKSMKLDDGARTKLHGIFERMRREEDFGNGRAARNIIEAAQMALASRLMKADENRLTNEQLTTITAADITEPPVKTAVKRVIGF